MREERIWDLVARWFGCDAHLNVGSLSLLSPPKSMWSLTKHQFAEEKIMGRLCWCLGEEINLQTLWRRMMPTYWARWDICCGMKWQSTLMFLARLWISGFMAIWMALVLFAYSGWGALRKIENSRRRRWGQVISAESEDMDLYST